MEFIQVINKRRSTRRFLTRKVESRKLQKILEIANKAPSAGNLQAYKIYLVENRVIKEKLAQVAGGQGAIIQAPINLIFCADPEVSGLHYRERGRTLYAIQDATIACCFAWLSAVDQGLSCVWIGAFDEEQVSKILKLSKSLRPVAILSIGYAAENPQPTHRKSLKDLIVEI